MARAKRSAKGAFTIRALAIFGFIVGVTAVARLGVVVAATPPAVWLDGYPRFVDLSLPIDPSRASLADAAANLVQDPALIRARLGLCQQRSDAEDPAGQCIRVVDDALRAAPSSGELWLFKADRLMRAGQLAGSLAALRQSYRMAPREGWIASARVVLGLQLYPLLPRDLQVATTDDLALVLELEEFLPPLRDAYGRDAALRAASVKAIDDLPPASRAEFHHVFGNG
jgi:hypothetical protein